MNKLMGEKHFNKSVMLPMSFPCYDLDVMLSPNYEFAKNEIFAL
jgi:hypothetical protein